MYTHTHTHTSAARSFRNKARAAEARKSEYKFRRPPPRLSRTQVPYNGDMFYSWPMFTRAKVRERGGGRSAGIGQYLSAPLFPGTIEYFSAPANCPDGPLSLWLSSLSRCSLLATCRELKCATPRGACLGIVKTPSEDGVSFAQGGAVVSLRGDETEF